MKELLFCTPCGRATVNVRLAFKWLFEEGFDVESYERQGAFYETNF